MGHRFKTRVNVMRHVLDDSWIPMARIFTETPAYPLRNCRYRAIQNEIQAFAHPIALSQSLFWLLIAIFFQK